MRSLIFAIVILPIMVWAQSSMQNVRFHNEATDTLRINEILNEVNAKHLSDPGERMVALGECFIGTPYVAGTLEEQPEMITVNIEEFDCTTFLETVMSMALTLGERRSSWRDVVYNLERVRYRNGQIDGYPSRLHYNTDWAVDNSYRGNITDVTTLFPNNSSVIKTIDFMTENASKYPALADSANYARMKAVEQGYRGYKLPYLKSSLLNAKTYKSEFKNGDIVALVTKIKNLDVTHVGIIVIKNGEPYLLHASSANKKVEITAIPFAEYMKKNHNLLGVRVFRLND